MLKRNGKVASRDDQLNLFDFARSREQANLSDAIRTDGRTPLAGVPAENGSETMEGLTRKLETEQKLTPQQAESPHQSAARPFSFVREDIFAFCRLEQS